VLKAVIKKRAYEDIVKQIRGLIEKGKLKRSDQLPSERELSETFKVSRATVREAIIALEAMMLVDRRQGNGTYVISSSEEALVQPLAAALLHEKDDLVDIFSLRKILEPGIAQLAAENATAEEIAELEEILKEQEEAVAEGKDPFRNDTQFHHVLARMSRKRVLERLFLALVDLLGQTRERYGQTDERKQKSLHGHRNVLAAIKDGDGAAARKAMRRHLEEVESVLFQKRKGGGRKKP
jgi:GntR family transcriptional regulator, transcriptional repressor for pyruvate dehydrogenase complex